MKIDLMSILYNTSIVLLALVSAVVITKFITRFIEKKRDKK
jgi:hypothetical protein